MPLDEMTDSEFTFDWTIGVDFGIIVNYKGVKTQESQFARGALNIEIMAVIHARQLQSDYHDVIMTS